MLYVFSVILTGLIFEYLFQFFFSILFFTIAKNQNGPIATYLFLSASFAIILVNFLPAFFDMSVV